MWTPAASSPTWRIAPAITCFEGTRSTPQPGRSRPSPAHPSRQEKTSRPAWRWTPAGQFAYVTNQNGNNERKGETEQRFTGVHDRPSDGTLVPVPGSPFASGQVPTSVAVDPSGKFAYVANHESDNVSGYTINPTTGALTPISGSPFAAGSNPFSVAVARFKPSFRAVHHAVEIANAGSNTVSVIDPATNTVAATVNVGAIPVEVTVTPNGTTAYVHRRGHHRPSLLSILPPTARRQ